MVDLKDSLILLPHFHPKSFRKFPHPENKTYVLEPENQPFNRRFRALKTHQNPKVPEPPKRLATESLAVGFSDAFQDSEEVAMEINSNPLAAKV